MIETPSLRTRVTLVTVGIVIVLVLALDLFVYLSLRDRLEDTLTEVLEARVALVERLADEVDSGEDLGAELVELGIPVRVSPLTGDEVDSEPAARRFDRIPPGPDPSVDTSESRIVTLDDGSAIEVFVSRAGVDSTLQRVLVIELVGSLAAIMLALVLLNRAAVVLTRPLNRMVDTAREIAGGDRSRRLDPSDPTTELGRMAAAFDQMIGALDTAVVEARRAETRSRRFLADAAHQLRTPLAGLRASAETLLAHPDGPDRDRMAANVAREAARLSRLVASLLRVARLDRGEPPARHPTDLVAVVNDEVARQRALAPALTFSVDAPDDMARVSCDPDAIREALANLLDNARRFARDRVDVVVRPQLGAVGLQVHDDGPGVPDDLRDSLFDRFVSTDGGSGLGLAIARGIVQSHGGDLQLRRDGSHDDAFEITLPVAGLDPR